MRARGKVAIVVTAVVVALALTGAAAVATGGIPLAGGTSSPAPSSGGTGTSAPTATPRPTDASADQLGRRFLATYVDDGRVIRRDQGGDTVSEGQAYGMLIALGVGDDTTFREIWTWTRKHLQREDGLMAWRFDDGKVVDDQPAADADLDMARALLVAGDRMHDPSYTAAGTRLAKAIATKLTVQTADGRILVPGLWATAGDPYPYNPSYASPEAFALIGSYTKDPVWTELADGARTVTAAMLAKAALPSDWAQVHADGTVDFMPGPDGQGQSVRYGYDAARLPIRFAESCQAPDRALAAKLVDPLDRQRTPKAELDLGGTPLTQDDSPLASVARAAARAAAGDEKGARSDLVTAQRQAVATPTYYGDAWVALGYLELTTSRLGGCPVLPGGAS